MKSIPLDLRDDPHVDANLKAPLFPDTPLLAITLALVSFSLVMVYSTTGILSHEKFGDSLLFVKRQALSAFLGVVLLFVVARFDVSIVRKLSPLAMIVALLFVVLPFIPGLGVSAGGARRWIRFGSIAFEPAEFSKVMYVVFLAGFFARHENKIASFGTGFFKPILLLTLLAVPLLLQPDFGSVVILMVVTLVMSLAAGARLKYIVGSIVLGIFALVPLVIFSPYRLRRVLGFLSPFTDQEGRGYQLIQSLIAVGTGGVSGVGLGASQQKLFFLPAAHTDFIFGVIAEELGFVGCVMLCVVFLIFLWRGMRLAYRYADDTFAFTLAVGLTLLIVAPAFLNIGVVVGLLPTKGMVLPLVGYGGSSLVACLLTVGLLLALARGFYRRL